MLQYTLYSIGKRHKIAVCRLHIIIITHLKIYVLFAIVSNRMESNRIKSGVGIDNNVLYFAIVFMVRDRENTYIL